MCITYTPILHPPYTTTYDPRTFVAAGINGFHNSSGDRSTRKQKRFEIVVVVVVVVVVAVVIVTGTCAWIG